MRALFLDLASHHGLLACVGDRAVIASEPVDHRIGDHELIPLTEKLLADAQWRRPAPNSVLMQRSFPDLTPRLRSGSVLCLTHIACVTGPGGFTSLRVAVSFANIMAHELEISAAGVHLSDLYEARIRTADFGQRTSGSFLWLHSTKKHELFVRGFGSFAELWPEPVHATDEEVLAKVPRGAQWTGELLPEHQALLEQKGAITLPLRPLQEVLPAFLARRTYEQKLLEPWYGRTG